MDIWDSSSGLKKCDITLDVSTEREGCFIVMTYLPLKICFLLARAWQQLYGSSGLHLLPSSVPCYYWCWYGSKHVIWKRHMATTWIQYMQCSNDAEFTVWYSFWNAISTSLASEHLKGERRVLQTRRWDKEQNNGFSSASVDYLNSGQGRLSWPTCWQIVQLF